MRNETDTARPDGATEQLLDFALSYAARGWAVLPLHTPDARGVCSCRKGEQCDKPGKHPRWHPDDLVHGVYSATKDAELIRQWWERWRDANVGIAAGEVSGLTIVDVDRHKGGDDSLAALEAKHDKLPDTVRNLSGGGGEHLLFEYVPGIGNEVEVADWPGLDTRNDGGLIVAPPSLHPSGRLYSWDLTSGPDDIPLATMPEWLAALLGAGNKSKANSHEPRADEPAYSPEQWAALRAKCARLAELEAVQTEKGVNYGTWLRVAALARHFGEVGQGWFLDFTEQYAPGCSDADRRKADAWLNGNLRGIGTCRGLGCDPERCGFEPFIVRETGEVKEPSPVRHCTLRPKAGGGQRGQEADDAEADASASTAPWPDPLDDAAYHGLAGDIVRAIEPHSEADPAALLAQLLAGFGNVIGRAPFFRVEASEHRTNLFAILTGPTSKGRKGTSWDYVNWLLTSADTEWSGRIQEGLSSGEGLIWAVRDPIFGREPIKEKGHITGYQEVETDPGVADKRLLVVETEFASVLKLATREGNTLSATIRRAWDTGHLRILNKNSPAKATNAHISMIGHITKPELLKHLEDTEAANGFGNRYLWVAVRRSKCLPEGGDLDSVDFGPLLRRLMGAVAFARGAGEMHRDEDARAIWATVYPELSEGRPGLFGAITARAEAQVLRLSCIYALLDSKTTIGTEHLHAALAVWDYCEASARWLFGQKLGDATADEVLRALRAAPNGLTRSEISGLFGRNKPAAELSRALALLASLGAARCTREESGGRRVERWQATGVNS